MKLICLCGIYFVYLWMEFFATMKEGKCVFYNRKSLTDCLRGFTNGTDLMVNIQPINEVKSLRQLKLAYLCFRKISEHTGYSVEESKMLAKIHQGLCAEATIEGKEITFCKSLSDMTKREISEFIMKMNDWASLDLGMNLLEFDDIKFLSDV